jgi:hypothetical protein
LVFLFRLKIHNYTKDREKEGVQGFRKKTLHYIKCDAAYIQPTSQPTQKLLISIKGLQLYFNKEVNYGLPEIKVDQDLPVVNQNFITYLQWDLVRGERNYGI